MRGWILSALLATALASPALAQQQGQSESPHRVRMAKGSPIAKILFAAPPLILEDDGTYADVIRRIGKEVSHECGAVESYGWDFKGQDHEQQQKQAEAVYNSTTQALEKAGYTLEEKKAASVVDPETLVFTAGRKENAMLLLWSPLQDATILLICDTTSAAKSPSGKAAQGKK